MNTRDQHTTNHPQPATRADNGLPTVDSRPDETAHLGQLADALSLRGYEATVITPASCLAVRIPGAALPQVIYSTGGQFWWHNPQVIAPAGKAALAAETITWALRARPGQPATNDTTSPLLTPPGQPAPPAAVAGSAGSPAC